MLDMMTTVRLIASVPRSDYVYEAPKGTRRIVSVLHCELNTYWGKGNLLDSVLKRVVLCATLHIQDLDGMASIQSPLYDRASFDNVTTRASTILTAR